MSDRFVPCRNGQALALKDVPELAFTEFRDGLLEGVTPPVSLDLARANLNGPSPIALGRIT